VADEHPIQFGAAGLVESHLRERRRTIE
jgi:hypothetical protein